MAVAGDRDQNHEFTPSYHDLNVCVFPHVFTAERDGFDMTSQCGHTLEEHSE